MAKDSQRDKAQRLLELHDGRELLVLPNIWDPLGARMLAAKGYPAVATASAALSASLGYQDGEKISRATLIESIERIAHGVDVPVTADIEAGYGATLEELQETICQVVEAGVVGINLEDSLKEGGGLRPVVEQGERIAAARRSADELGVRLVINARIDSFLSKSFADPAAALEDAVARARDYVEAGADCIYPIGPGDEATVRRLRERISAPLNILVTSRAAPLATLRAIGVNRVSFGPWVMRACLRQFVDVIEGVQSTGDTSWLGDALPAAELAPYLRAEGE